MNHATQDYQRPGHEAAASPEFPHAGGDWSREGAQAMALSQGLIMTEGHWRAVRALQELNARDEAPTLSARDLHDALDEYFHAEGGIKYVYLLFPKGPLAQGCPIAGLEPPSGTQDRGFGSAV
ncbi:MAG: TusE/DsrC/DsvC family sulfur relay protein [Thiobacillus sp.]|nr:TusE/DsrC/DsvC family sulfur relay protein [Thiobacillus sp.]